MSSHRDTPLTSRTVDQSTRPSTVGATCVCAHGLRGISARHMEGHFLLFIMSQRAKVYISSCFASVCLYTVSFFKGSVNMTALCCYADLFMLLAPLILHLLFPKAVFVHQKRFYLFTLSYTSQPLCSHYRANYWFLLCMSTCSNQIIIKMLKANQLIHQL